MNDPPLAGRWFCCRCRKPELPTVGAHRSLADAGRYGAALGVRWPQLVLRASALTPLNFKICGSVSFLEFVRMAVIGSAMASCSIA